jgi:preprotein translocase subunit YajC
MGVLILPALILVMYFVLVRPQQQRTKQHKTVLSNLDVGDDVVTTAGIYGRVSDIDGATVFLQVSDTVELKVTKESVAGLVSYEAEADEEAEDEIGDEAEDGLVDDE